MLAKEPSYITRVPFAAVDCSGNEEKYVKEVLESGWLTTASMAKRLEQSIANYTDAKYSFAVNSCTAALHLGLEALGVASGDSVFVPSFTFTASAEVIRYLGAHPVFLDVDYETRSLTPEIVEQAIKNHPETKVLLVVHFGGQAVPMLDSDNRPGILSVCRSNGVRIIEDAAHAFPAKDQGKNVGSIGDITCLSFYANKTMTTGEGGMLLTDDSSLADRIGIMRLHGIDRPIWDRFTNEKNTNSWEYDVLAPGYKYNMPDVNAAIGMAQFERLDKMRECRQQVAEIYLDKLANVELLDLPKPRVAMQDHSWHLFNVVVKPNKFISRNEIIERLANDKIGTSVHYKPLHRMTYYRNKYDLRASEFPISDRLWLGTFSLPIYSSMPVAAAIHVADRLGSYFNDHAVT